MFLNWPLHINIHKSNHPKLNENIPKLIRLQFHYPKKSLLETQQSQQFKFSLTLDINP